MNPSKSNEMFNSWTMAALVAIGLVSLVGNTGCDLAGGLINLDNILSWGGLVDVDYASALGLPGYPS